MDPFTAIILHGMERAILNAEIGIVSALTTAGTDLVRVAQQASAASIAADYQRNVAEARLHPAGKANFQ